MSFDSLAYALFLPCVCLLHWLLPQGCRWLLLLGASYVFYASWDVPLTLLILSVTGVSYLAGRMIDCSPSLRVKRLWLSLTLLTALGLLAYFKYANLLGSTFAALTGGSWRTMDILLPVGISFYTFQALSYVIDVYRGSLAAERHAGYYALYIAFFPQLVAGPIERAGKLLPQLRSQRRLTSGDVTAGMRLLISGFFRKLVIADLIAPFVDAVYRSPLPDGSAVLCATLLFALQIYCDFSGYSEIAMGSARLLGIRLMRNFDRPYAAQNIRAFWRRWHISLTVWFTDYLYIPLGGSRKGLGRQLFATLAVFALCGLWHGADWSFVVWGLLHAAYMNAHTLLHRSGRVKGGWWERMGMLLAVCFAWLFFRAQSLSHAGLLLRQLCSPWQLSAGLELLMTAAIRSTPPLALLALLGSMLLMLSRLPAVADDSRPLPAGVWAGLLLAILMAVLIRLDAGVTNAFIYFQF